MYVPTGKEGEASTAATVPPTLGSIPGVKERTLSEEEETIAPEDMVGLAPTKQDQIRI
jgi:hypothetical protein